MRVTDIVRDDLPQLARLLEALTRLATPLDRLEAAYERMARHPDYHLVGVRDGETLAGAVCGIVCL
ncbi:MAG: GNAT family N-acetyltransferase, partial [Acidobacteriota bacterium]